MATTKYTVFTVNAEGVETELATKSKKSTAVELATATRNEQATRVVVRTQAGNVAFEQDAPKKIKMSPRYTRTVELPEGVTLPVEGRVAYVRPRQNAAVIDVAGAESEERYAILNLKSGKLLKQRFATTRAAGARMSEGVGVKPAPAVEATPEQEPANA